MKTDRIERICEGVAFSVAQVRIVFCSSLPVTDILNRFWYLQDNLSRLLEAITDHPAQTLEVLESYPSLLGDVADVLERSSKLPSLRNIAAVREAGDSINSSLAKIQGLWQSRALAASASL